jgi:outer membrane protein TolC
MKKIKLISGNQIVINLLIIFLIFQKLNAQDTISGFTIQEAYKIALQNNQSIKQLEYYKKEKQEEQSANKSLYLPKIGLSAEYMFLEKDLHLDLTPVRDAIIPLYQTLGQYGNFSIQGVPDNIATQMVREKLNNGLSKIENGEWDRMIQEKEFGALNATFQWPVFAGGKIRVANKLSELKLNESNYIYKQKENELLSELVDRYYGLVLAKQAIIVRKEVLNGMQKYLDDAILMNKEGLISKADVLNIKVYHSQAERELSKSIRTSDLIEESLLNTMALNDRKVIPVSKLFYFDEIQDLQFFKETAIKNNPKLKQIESNRKMTIEGVKYEKSELYPAIAITGMYDIANKNLSPYSPEWLVGVGMKWTIFDGTYRLKKIKAANYKVKQVEELNEKANNDILIMIEKLYQELQINKEQLDYLDNALNYAMENLKYREKGFSEQIINSSELIDARLQLSKVKIERLEAMYKFDVSLAKLLEYAGVPELLFEYLNKSNIKTESY